MRVLLGVTGSVASVLGEKLVDAFEVNHEVKVVQTDSSRRILDLAGSKYQVISEKDEWSWRRVGDPIQHIELREWMDILVIAPLSANTLGKMVHGICDNLLLSIWLAAGNKPVVVAPAMNTQMWMHPIVVMNTHVLRSLGVFIVDPVEKKLACGETGVGAMAPIEQVIEAVERTCAL